MARPPLKRQPDDPRRPAGGDDGPWDVGGDVDARANGPVVDVGDGHSGGRPASARGGGEAGRDEHQDGDPKPGDKAGDGEAKPDDPKKADDGPAAKRKRRVVLAVGLLVLAAGVAGGVLFWLHARHFATTDDAFIEGRVVPITPQVSAKVLKVYVDDNQYVKRGDPLVDLDPIDYQVALEQAKGMEAAARGKRDQARAQVPAAEAGVREAEASVDVAEVNFANADADLKRYQALEERARSKQQYDNAVAAQKTAAAQVAQAKARLATSQSQVVTSQAAVVAAEGDLAKASADVHRAEVNLGYCHIVAPIEGRVTRRSVEVGVYGATTQALLAIVKPEVWVVANYKETQLEDMRVGQSVTVSVDSFGGLDVTGKVQSIQAGTGSRFSVLPAENATGNFVKVVQRVPVKILLDDADPGQGKFLSPGMSVVVKVKVRD